MCFINMATNARFRWNNVVANMSLHGGDTAVSRAMKTTEDIKLQINATTAKYASYNNRTYQSDIFHQQLLETDVILQWK